MAAIIFFISLAAPWKRRVVKRGKDMIQASIQHRLATYRISFVYLHMEIGTAQVGWLYGAGLWGQDRRQITYSITGYLFSPWLIELSWYSKFIISVLSRIHGRSWFEV